MVRKFITIKFDQVNFLLWLNIESLTQEIKWIWRP